MFKIKYLPTGNVFLLPEETASLLREKYPDDYRILEKNGRKFNDKKRRTVISDKTILSKILDE